MFRNHNGKEFQDVTTSGGFGHLQKGHGIAFGDIENSGDEDVVEKMGGAAPGDTYSSVLYHNPGHGNHWISLELEGVQTNRSAFGARIRITAQTPEGKRQIFRTVGYGSSFGGNPLRQHIGLGKASSVTEIEVFWPVPGKSQVFHNIAADRAYRLRQGDARLTPQHYQRFSFRSAPVAQPHH